MEDFSSNKPDTAGHGFVTTQWSLIMAATQLEGNPGRCAMENLCRSYWRPVYAFVRRMGRSAHDAEDLTQEFFHRLLEKDLFSRADATRGRFRSFLLTTLKNFLHDRHDHDTRLKRGGNATILPMDTAKSERWLAHAVDPNLGPDRSFDLQWQFSILEAALGKLREDYARMGKSMLFDELSPYLSKTQSEIAYQALADALGLTANAVAAAVYRMRRKFRELVRKEICETVLSPEEAEAELRELFG